MRGSHDRGLAVAVRKGVFGILAYALSCMPATAASPEGSPPPEMPANGLLNGGRWSVRHAAAVDGAGHLSVRRGTKDENARWVLVYGMTVAEALDLQQQVDDALLPVTLTIFPRGGIVTLDARPSEDWDALTMPLTRNLIDALARGHEVHLTAGRGVISYRATLAGSAKALRQALDR